MLQLQTGNRTITPLNRHLGLHLAREGDDTGDTILCLSLASVARSMPPEQQALSFSVFLPRAENVE